MKNDTKRNLAIAGGTGLMMLGIAFLVDLAFQKWPISYTYVVKSSSEKTDETKDK